LAQAHRIPHRSALYTELLKKAARHNQCGQQAAVDVFDEDISSAMHHQETSGPPVNQAKTLPLETDNSEQCTAMDTDDDSRNIEQTRGAVEEQDLELQLQTFLNRMMSPDGGLKNEKSARQQRSQVKAILAALQQTELSAMWNKTVLEDFKKYASDKQYLPGTCKSY